MKDSLELLLERDEVEDIVLSPQGISYFARGRWRGPAPSADCEPAALRRIAQSIAETASLSLGPLQPTVDTYFEAPDGRPFRAHVALVPLVLRGPEITLRRLPSALSFRVGDFTQDPLLAARLKTAALEGRNILVCGTTGAGKTSLLTALLAEIPEDQRVLILEDSPELPLPNRLSNKLLARPDRYGYRAGAHWELEHLVFESLRMRPSRLVVGECRGSEALGLARALQTGHDGLMTTLHASSCVSALERFRELVAHASPSSPGAPGVPASLSRQWDLVIHIGQTSEGQRRIVEVHEPPEGSS